MKIVVDSNRIIAALVKESTTRKLLYQKDFEFLAPDFIATEIFKYKDHIIASSGISVQEFDILLSLLLEYVTIVPREDYQSCIDESKSLIDDEKDVPYFAVCLSIKALGIWTHDEDFRKQQKIKIFTNKDMLELIEGQVE